MASTEIAAELDDELRACKEALQDQAQEMLSLLLQFEARLKYRLDQAEARIAALQAASGKRNGRDN
jgi:hypothetical protein